MLLAGMNGRLAWKANTSSLLGSSRMDTANWLPGGVPCFRIRRTEFSRSAAAGPLKRRARIATEAVRRHRGIERRIMAIRLSIRGRVLLDQRTQGAGILALELPGQGTEGLPGGPKREGERVVWVPEPEKISLSGPKWRRSTGQKCVPKERTACIALLA
jgi:hypothetical protein